MSHVEKYYDVYVESNDLLSYETIKKLFDDFSFMVYQGKYKFDLSFKGVTNGHMDELVDYLKNQGMTQDTLFLELSDTLTASDKISDRPEIYLETVRVDDFETKFAGVMDSIVNDYIFTGKSSLRKPIQNDVFDVLYSYIRDFGIEEEDVLQCIKHTASSKGISEDETLESVLHYVLTLQDSCISKSKKYGMELKDYQSLAVSHMLRNRGMVAAFSTGVGKTLTAVSVARCILGFSDFLGKNIKVIVITPTSLVENFKKEMRQVGMGDLIPRFKFYTTSKFQKDYKNGLVDCRKTLFIVDEAHNFRTDYRGEFSGRKIMKQDTGAQFSVMCSEKAWKVLLLTATPIYNKPHDIVNLASMVKGVYPPFKGKPMIDLKNSPQEFKQKYGNVFLFQDSDKSNFPSRRDILVEIVMTREYLEKYEALEAVLKRKENVKQRKMLNIADDEKVKNSFMVKLRTASNKLEGCLKCPTALKIIGQNEKTIFFSEFKSSGVNLLTEELDRQGIPYYVIDGSVSQAKRHVIVQNFNANKVKLLIITKAGGEGLDLKGVRNVILFEKGWNFSGQEQVVGRAVRYKSHAHLPEDQRNVTVYHLIAVKPTGVDFPKVLSAEMKKLKVKYDIEIVNKELARHGRIKEANIAEDAGADAYMFAQAVKKQVKSDALKEALISIEVGKDVSAVSNLYLQSLAVSDDEKGKKAKVVISESDEDEF